MAEDNPIRLFVDEDVWLGLAAALQERALMPSTSTRWVEAT